MIVNANALHLPIASKTVQTVITSPPYYGLRDYGTAKWIGGDTECNHVPYVKSRAERPRNGLTGGLVYMSAKDPVYRDTCGKCGAVRVDDQLGLEPTPDAYVANMVAVFREVWRVMRDDGTLWLNVGDSYAAQRGGTGLPPQSLEGSSLEADAKVRKYGDESAYHAHRNAAAIGLKHKDLIGIPWRLAFALQADGWYLRSDIIWAKPNPMPESVTDRPTKAHEYLFLLTKSPRYYYDADAVREEYAEASLPRALRGLSSENKWADGAPGSTAHTMSQGRPNQRKEFEAEHGGGGSGFKGHSGYVDANGRLLIDPNGRNKRTVWTIATQPTREAHFATFPEKLVEPCILAGTSERGCCQKCGKPWERLVERTAMVIDRSNRTHELGRTRSSGTMVEPPTSNTTGWQPGCDCDAGEPVPCVVFDPFSGSGTVERVAIRLRRRSIGTELNYRYIRDIVTKRTADIQPVMV